MLCVMLASRTDCKFCLQVFDICFHEVSTRVALSADARTVLDTTLSRESSLKSSRSGQFGAFTKACGPKCESSRPYPLFLTLPTGTRGVQRRYTVDEDTTGVQVARHLACQSNVFGPYITAQSKLACIHRVSCTTRTTAFATRAQAI